MPSKQNRSDQYVHGLIISISLQKPRISNQFIHGHEMSTTRYEYRGESDVSRLAECLTFERAFKTATNRLLKSAMAEGLSTWDNTDLEARGIPTKEVIELYRR